MAVDIDLRTIARVREIDRRSNSIKQRLTGVKWVGGPGLALTVAVVVRRVLVEPPPLTLGLGLTALGLVTGVLALQQGLRSMRDTASTLEAERAALLGLPGGTAAAKEASHRITFGHIRE